MPEVKKLITGFLIVAAGAGSSAWILSSLGNQSATGTITQDQSPSIASSSITDNAFSPAQGAGETLGAGATSADQTDPNNLTAGMADAFVNSVVTANPNDIQMDASGNAQLTPPDSQTLADALQNEPSLQNMATPDWNQEVADAQSKIKTVQNSSTTVINYLNAFNEINTQQLVQSGLLSSAKDNADSNTQDSSFLPGAQSAILKMLAKAIALPTPTSLVGFQKSFIKLLVYEKNISLLTQNISQDPAKNLTIIQAQNATYDAALQDFNDQSHVFSNFISVNAQREKTGLFAFIQDMFFIKTAEAQAILGVPVVDLTTKAAIAAASGAQTANGWAVYFKKFAFDMALQIFRNTLMALIQQKVLAYIQNSGAPRFITNMGSELVKAGEMSALSVIDSNFACISPGGNLSQIQIVLHALYKTDNNVCQATFASALANGVTPQQFYNKFSNGGFVSFGTTLQPSNNFYGGLFFTAQAAGQASEQAQGLFSVKTTASQGYRNSQVCNDGSNPNGTSIGCVNNNDPSDIEIAGAGGTCRPGYTPKQTPNNGLCGNGSEPAVTMPGIVNSQALGHALGGSTQLVAAANSIAGVVQAVASSLLSGLANQAINSVKTVVNGALQGDGGISSINPSTITAPTTVSLSCSPGSPTVTAGSSASFFADGGTFDANTNPPTYRWSSPGGQTGSGQEFDVVYTTPGIHTVTVSDSAGDAATTCSVQVGPSTSPLSCSPATVNITVGSSTSFVATGGTFDANANAPTYRWSSSDGQTGSGNPFGVTYSAPGTFTITLSDSVNDAPTTCSANVQ